MNFPKIPNMKTLKQKQTVQDIKNYLVDRFDVDKDCVDNFVFFINKDIKEKHELYKNITSPYTNDELENSMDFSDSSNTNLLKTKFSSRCYYPDLNFEEQMEQEFQDFLDILLQDGQQYLQQCIKIDDFYRLFAPFYHPMF